MALRRVNFAMVFKQIPRLAALARNDNNKNPHHAGWGLTITLPLAPPTANKSRLFQQSDCP